jgi:small subunit ribosomal protein S16
MLAIKLRTIGKKHQRSFRVIVQESRAKVQGKFVEDLGWYNPHTNSFNLNTERMHYWIGVGAQPTKTVSDILKKTTTKKKEVKKESSEKKTKKVENKAK